MRSIKQLLVVCFSILVAWSAMPEEKWPEFQLSDMPAFLDHDDLNARALSARIAILVHIPQETENPTSMLKNYWKIHDLSEDLSDNVVVGILFQLFPTPDDRSVTFLRKLRCASKRKLFDVSNDVAVFFSVVSNGGGDRACMAAKSNMKNLQAALYDLTELERSGCLSQTNLWADVMPSFFEIHDSQGIGSGVIGLDETMTAIQSASTNHCNEK